MKNVSQIIKKYDKRVTKTIERSVAPCNCRDKNSCPMNGNCRVQNALPLPQKIQRNMFTLALLRTIGNSATTITPCHSKIRNTKMTQPFQLFYGSLRSQQKKPLCLHGQF